MLKYKRMMAACQIFNIYLTVMASVKWRRELAGDV
jgi:hypothetical protein